MPQAANLVVNNASAVAKTFTLMSPAAGDGGLAVFQLKEGGSPVAYPTLTALARATANQSRKAQVRYRHPYSYTETTTGLIKAGPAFEVNVDASIPYAFPETLRPDAIALVSNLIAHALIKEMLRDGYPLV